MELLRRLYAPDYMLKPAQKQQEHYSTKEIYKTFMKVAWPATAESVLIGLVNFIDSVMVSSIGHAAVAAVGLTGQPRLIVYERKPPAKPGESPKALAISSFTKKASCVIIEEVCQPKLK